MDTIIELAQPSDFSEILALLDACGLPEAGLACRPGVLITVAREDGRIVGCAALELYGQQALLRSVAVAADRRGRGLGDRVVEAALGLAGRLSVSDLYLLTDSAEGFFARHGFETFDRSRVPSAVAASPGFATCHCADAICMARSLEARRGRRSFGTLALSLHDLAPLDRPEPERCGC